MSERTSSDATILDALCSGAVAVDAASGAIFRRGRKARTTDNGSGYQRIVISAKTCLAHRVIWLAVHGSIPDGLQVNHRNGDPTDNRLANLELVTESQNKRHALGMAALRKFENLDVDPDWLDQVRQAASSAHTTSEMWALLKARLAETAA